MKNLNSLPIEWVERIFMRLHGRFGNQFFDKYKIGKLNNDGEDAGIANAKATWADELSGVSVDMLKAALAANYAFPPSCDDFKSKCVVKHEIEFFTAIAAPMNNIDNKRNSNEVLEYIAANIAPKRDPKAWARLIIANPSNYLDISLKYAKEALNVETGKQVSFD